MNTRVKKKTIDNYITKIQLFKDIMKYHERINSKEYNKIIIRADKHAFQLLKWQKKKS